MAGAVFNGQCFLSQQDALDAYYGSARPAQEAGTVAMLQSFVKVDGVWMLRRSSIDQGGTVTNLPDAAVPVPAFPVCDPMQGFNDGLTVGWGLAAIMIAAWTIASMRRAV